MRQTPLVAQTRQFTATVLSLDDERSETIMEVLHERCAGMDIFQRDAKVCVRTPGARAGTFTKQVTVHGAMHAKNLPGRKTDVSDAQWLAELGAHGLVRGSFVPPWPTRRLRDLTRQRTLLTAQRTREIQKLEKLIESTGIKYTSVATRTRGVSGRAFLEALIAGQTSPDVLTDLARGRLRATSEQLRPAFQGTFTTHHDTPARLHLDWIDLLDTHVHQLTGLVDVLVAEHGLGRARDMLATIPGISVTGAENIIAEARTDMTFFETCAHLASRAGVCPGRHESAGKTKRVRTRPGNTHLKGALGIAAMAAIRKNGSFFQHRYKRLAARRGPSRALVAIEHSLIVAIWHILTRQQPYHPTRTAA